MYPRVGDIGEDLTRLFGTWSGRVRSFEFERECIAPGLSAGNLAGKDCSLDLARLWALSEVEHLRATRQMEVAVQTAARHQLVTPVSGAVVLETQSQYQRANLQPAAPESVPMVPEPSVGPLLAFGALLFAARIAARARQNRQGRH